MPKKKQEKRRLKKMAKFHLIFSVGLFVLYLGLSLSYSPEFFLKDIRDKFQAFGADTITVMATVLGPPVKPVVSTSAVCSNGTLSITLAWPADENSTAFDIERDGAPLVTGLGVSHYKDSLVAVGTTYVYVVTARGPMGSGVAVSDPVPVSTSPDCQVILPPPAVQIISISGQNILSFTGIPETTDLRPNFSGTTNIPNANIFLLIHGDIITSANIQANANGFWSWTPPLNLPLGPHTLFVAATDPLDPTRTASVSQDFTIVQEKSQNKNNSSKSSNNSSSQTKKPAAPAPNAPANGQQAGVPLDFSLALDQNAIFQGKDLATKITLSRLDPQYENSQAIVKYIILDDQGQQQSSALSDAMLHAGEVLSKNINVPTYFKSGQYSIRAEIIIGQYDVSRVNNFSVLPLPLVNLGGGIVATYPEILSQIGTISLWLLICLLIWLLLFSREYWLYLHAIRHITENNLAKTGLFGKPKGKGVSR